MATTANSNRGQKWLSLEKRTIGAIALSCMLLGFVAQMIGLLLFNRVLSKQSFRRAYEIAHHAAMAVENGKEDPFPLIEQVMDIYNGLTEEQLALNGTAAYREFFKDVQIGPGSTYHWFYTVLSDYITNEDVSDVYLAIFDRKRSALVYFVDPEMKNQFMPGDWEIVSQVELEKFLNWDGNDILFDVSNTYRYGWLCTAGVPLYDKNGELCAFVLSDVGTDTGKSSMISYSIQTTVAILAFTAIITWILTRFMRKTVVKPINDIAAAAKAYVKDKQAGLVSTDRFKSLKIDTSLELSNLSHVMAKMERDLSQQEESNLKINAEKQKIITELDMAKKIQSSTLPSTFPAFPDRKEFDIYATMDPAREVGGDFYDFFLIDDDHLCLIMADVSGKGIPAALFMMITKVIVQSCAMLGKTASEILAKTNEALCSNNKTEMFVTMWVGIVELSTGKVTASNAGHEYPALYRNGKQFELIKDQHSLFVGGMPDTKYKEYTFQLNSGDKIFQYTDGVTEATDSKLELFGTDRMIKALNIDPKQAPAGILKTVHSEVNRFVGKAEQFDDITMLCFEYKGN